MENSINEPILRYKNIMDDGQIVIQEGPGKGFASIPWILIEYMGALGLNPTEFLISVWLLRHSWDERGLAFPSTSKLERSTKISAKTLYKYIKQIEIKGYISRLDVALPITDRRIRRIVSGFFSALTFAVICDPHSKYCKTNFVENAYTILRDSPEEFIDFHTPKQLNDYYNARGQVFDWLVLLPHKLDEGYDHEYDCVCVDCGISFQAGNKNAKRCMDCNEFIREKNWQNFLLMKNEQEEFLQDSFTKDTNSTH